MSRFFVSSLITLVLAIGVAGMYAPVAQAATTPAAATSASPPASSVNTSAGTSATTNHPETYSKNPGSNSSYDFLMTKIMSLFAWLLGVAAVTLDYAVFYTVITMGNYVNHLSAIGVAWRILRDVGNIILIFGFLAIGITTILNVNWYGGGTKMLPILLIAAVFLNFSLFISEAVIDVGNLFATEIYTQINGGVFPTQAVNYSNFSTAVSNEGISNKIMGQLGMQTIYSGVVSNHSLLNAGNSWFIGFMGILLFMTAAFVMFSLAFILIARFIILIILIIIAPIGFAGLAVPKLSSSAKEWWDMLFKQTITAPVLLLLLYVALAVITDAQFLNGFGVGTSSPSASSLGYWTGFIDNGNLSGFAGMMLSFLVAMGLLYFVVITAKEISAFGSGAATKAAGAFSFGFVAKNMRRTVGLGSQYASRKIRNSRHGETRYGRILAGVADRGATASFDVRSAKLLGGLKALGIDAGTAEKGGYRAREKEAIEKHVKYAESLPGRKMTAAEQEEVLKPVIKKREEAQAMHDEAARRHEEVTQRHAKQKAEVESLEFKQSLYRKDKDGKGGDPETERELKTARQSLMASETDVAAANGELKKSKENLAGEIKNETETRDKVAKVSSKKFAQEAYAKNVMKSPISSWVMFGPGGQEAGRKIIKDAGKNQEQKQIEALLKRINDEGKTKDKGGKGGGTEGEKESKS